MGSRAIGKDGRTAVAPTKGAAVELHFCKMQSSVERFRNTSSTASGPLSPQGEGRGEAVKVGVS